MAMKLANLFFVLFVGLLVVCATHAKGQERDEKAVRRAVRCRLRVFPGCFLVSLPCPVTCPRSCLMDCTICRPVCTCNRPGAVCQDPRFVGGDGITFYFHGRKDAFCLVSDHSLHINAHFIGKRNPAMKRDFTWVQSIAILFDSHSLSIAAKNTSSWEDSSDRLALALALDDSSISLPSTEGATWGSPTTPRVAITRTRAANAVTVEAEGRFAVAATVVPITEEESRVHRYGVTADDCFAYLDLGFKFYGLSEEVSGVLGQTYQANYTSKVKVGEAMPVVGGEREFRTSHLLAADSAVSRFRIGGGGGRKLLVKEEGEEEEENPALQCESGSSGRGVFCQR